MNGIVEITRPTNVNDTYTFIMLLKIAVSNKTSQSDVYPNFPKIQGETSPKTVPIGVVNQVNIVCRLSALSFVFY